MSNLTENIYNVADLYIVSLKEEFAKYEKPEYTELFNPNLFFIVEKFVIKKDDGLPYFFEVYTECITGRDLFMNESREESQVIPNIFETMEKFPNDYLNEEEKQTGKITTSRIFQIFQEINIKSKKLTKKR